MKARQFSVTAAVAPWFHDHRFGGRTILPAVETMLLLAAVADQEYPGVDTAVMEQVSFPKFLPIAPGEAELSVVAECSRTEDGSLAASLLSRVQLKSFTKLVPHGKVVFPAAGSSARLSALPAHLPTGSDTRQVEAERIYRELVPFGPTYRTLHGSLTLTTEGAWGMLAAPELSHDQDLLQLGSPFPLDGAFHAACVHGQQFVDFVPFPVGFARRLIVMPTQPGQSYFVRIAAIDRSEHELIYDLSIFDGRDRLCESVSGLRMRDVSRGTIKPPAWIRSQQGKRQPAGQPRLRVPAA